MGVTHFPFDLGPRHQSGDRVDHQDIESPGADQHVGDLQRLLPGVGLRNEKLVDIHPDRLGVNRVEGVLGVDEGGDTPVALGLGHDVEGEAGLPRAFRPIELDDAAPRHATYPQCEVERESTCGDDIHLDVGRLSHLHDGALAKLPLDLAERHVQGLVTFTSHFGSFLEVL
jgi:hypothetical protein